MVWEFRRPACGEMEYWPMAGIKAGVVTEADVEGLPTAPGPVGLAIQFPATWTAIWVLVAFAYLFAIYFGMIRITRRG